MLPLILKLLSYLQYQLLTSLMVKWWGTSLSVRWCLRALGVWVNYHSKKRKKKNTRTVRKKRKGKKHFWDGVTVLLDKSRIHRHVFYRYAARCGHLCTIYTDKDSEWWYRLHFWFSKIQDVTTEANTPLSYLSQGIPYSTLLFYFD